MDKSDINQIWQIQAASCEKCPPSHKILNPIPGSILDNSLFTNGPDWDLLEALPPELLRREYDLHIKQFERTLSGHPAETPKIYRDKGSERVLDMEG